ncbi:MAG: DUF1573 domain-containing protein [Bacteroidota bacterium]
MSKILTTSLACFLMMSILACQQEVAIPPEIIFVDQQADENQNATIRLEDVFVAKTNWESNASSQRKQSPQSSSSHRGMESRSRSQTSANYKKPQIRIPEDVYDFGFVDEGELVSHSFRLYNDGPGLWKIEEFLPSCGCTNVKATATEVESGAYIDVSFNLETVGRPGAQQKLIEIFSNAGYHRLLIKGVVYPPKFSQSQSENSIEPDSL